MTNPYIRTAAEESKLVEHAKRELKLLGLDDGDEMNKAAMDAVLELMKVFSKQGHSGFSAGYVAGLFNKLSMFAPLTPITGEDSEWGDITTEYDNDCKMYQNTRYCSVFKKVHPDGTVECYDIEGKIFEEPDGVRYTNGDSAVPVTFPYTPKTEIVKVPKDKVASGRKYLPWDHRLYWA